jgi:hypothetical protein
MTASRKEYLTDLLEDCEALLKEFEGYDHECYEGSGKANLIAAMILADSLNGLRKGILTVQGRVKSETG